MGVEKRDFFCGEVVVGLVKKSREPDMLKTSS